MIRSLYIGCFLIIGTVAFIQCDTEVFSQGEKLYQSQCASCHMEKGQGLKQLIPPIASSDYYLNHYDDLVCNIVNGMKGEIVVNGISYNEEMLPIRKMTATEMTNLINFMNHKWYPELAVVMMKDVQGQIDQCLQK